MVELKQNTYRQISYFEKLNKESTGSKEIQAVKSVFKMHKIPRKLAYILEQSTLTNKHTCGLYNYVWLLCHARTYTDETNFGIDRDSAYINVPIQTIVAGFASKTPRACIPMLDQLQNAGLIRYNYKPRCKNIQIAICKRQSKSILGKKRICYERSAIKNHIGYVFVKSAEVKPLIKNAEGFSPRDAMIYFWMNVIYNDKWISITKKCPLVYITSTFRLKYRNIAQIWHCSKATAGNTIHQLESKGFISIQTFHGVGVFIAIPKFTELLWGKSSQPITKKEIEVILLHHDPDPAIQAQKQKIAKYASIAKYYRKKGNRFMTSLYTDRYSQEKFRLAIMQHRVPDWIKELFEKNAGNNKSSLKNYTSQQISKSPPQTEPARAKANSPFCNPAYSLI